MNKKRRITLSETRKVPTIQDLRDWLAEIPAVAELRGIKEFDGSVTLYWREER
jgi:hypothetical protein